MSYGFVYVLANSAMPGFYKVGVTERSPHARCEELNRATGIPRPFEVVCYAEYERARSKEREIHEALNDLRDASNREFFCGDLKRITDEVMNGEESLSVCTHQLDYFLLISRRSPRSIKSIPLEFRGFE